MKHGEQHDSNWLQYDPEDTLMLKPAKKNWDQGKVQKRMRSRRNQMFWQAEAVRRPDPGHHSIKSPLPNKPEDWEGWGCWSNPTRGGASDEERELVNCRRGFLTPYSGHSVGEIDAFLSTKRQYTSTPTFLWEPEEPELERTGAGAPNKHGDTTDYWNNTVQRRMNWACPRSSN